MTYSSNVLPGTLCISGTTLQIVACFKIRFATATTVALENVLAYPGVLFA